MCKAAILMAEGYEEGETFTIVDILRRNNIVIDTIYFDQPFVKGMHGMMIQADKPFNESIKDYDLIFLPGGRPGGANLLANEEVIQMIQYFNDQHKWIAAMCSGTVVLEKAQVILGRKVTGYTNYQDKLLSGNFTGRLVEVDENLITSQGPATPYPIAFKIVELLGKDPSYVADRLCYKEAGGKIE